MARTAAFQPDLRALREAIPTMLEGQSNHIPTMQRLKWLHGPLSFRTAAGLSAPKMRDILEAAGAQVRTHQTIYTWERAEREPTALPCGYWRHRYMPASVVDAYHAALVIYVEWATRGRYTARVSGKRRWTVSLRRVR